MTNEEFNVRMIQRLRGRPPEPSWRELGLILGGVLIVALIVIAIRW